MVATLGDPVLVTDLQNNALAWNAAAEEAFGWSAAEVLAGGVSIVPPDELDAASRRLRQVMESGQPVTFESERMARDGRRVPVLATVSPLRSESGEISGLIALYKDLALSRQREAQAQTVALLEERQRIAMELHDGVMQSLYGLALSLNAAASGSSVDRRDVLRRAGREIDGIIQDVRNYIFDLRPRQLAGSGIRASLMTLAEELRVSTLIQPQVQLLAGVEEALSEEAGTHLVHVAREATSNIIRHSHATSAYIQLARNQRGLRLVIRDNGLGFDAADTGRRLGDGTRIMKERAMAMGADLQINSAPGEGTTIALDIPLAQGETERQQTRVLLVDDHELVRRGLHELFESCSDIEVTAAVASADEAVEAARRLPPDVVVMDVHLADHAAI
ncbi:MAG TPA: PAS domain-containing protein, partial [Chloroflexota bacterium]|nr:PAS domain-containing protein [Chloroflexota bacterium]